MQGRAALGAINDQVTALEHRHNEVLDHLETVGSQAAGFRRALREQMGVLDDEMRALKDAIAERLGRAKSAAVLLSLIAQREEVGPLQSRIDRAPYPFYETSEDFRRRLDEI